MEKLKWNKYYGHLTFAAIGVAWFLKPLPPPPPRHPGSANTAIMAPSFLILSLSNSINIKIIRLSSAPFPPFPKFTLNSDLLEYM